MKIRIIYIALVMVAMLATMAPLASAAPPADARITDEGWFAPRKPDHPKPALPAKVTRPFVIPIHGPITESLYNAVARKVVQCKAKGAELVIFDMDTPGGRSDVMGDIVDLITKDLKDIYTVAFVNPEAISAGAIISLACTDIIMTPSGVIGDAMPIMISGGKLMPIPKAERGKIESYARGKIRLLAERNGHNDALCQAMITLTRIVWLIRDPKTKELRLVDPDSDTWRTSVSGAPDVKSDQKPPAKKLKWEFVRTVDRDDELVTMTAKEAKALTLTDHILKDMDQVQAHYNITVKPLVLGDTWSEEVVAFLTSPVVRGLLMFLGILAIYAEFQAPGVGLPGGVAVVCFTIVFGSQYLTGMAQWWEIALFAVGLVLIGLEVFVIPGFGVAGISGIICCVAGLLAIFVANAPDKLPIPSSDLDWALFENGVISLACAAAMATVGAAILARFLPKIPWVSRLVLAPVDAPPEDPVSENSPIRDISVGDCGVVEAICRPVGKVRFGDSLLDATADGQTIEPGASVRVVRHEGNRLVVEPTENM